MKDCSDADNIHRGDLRADKAAPSFRTPIRDLDVEVHSRNLLAETENIRQRHGLPGLVGLQLDGPQFQEGWFGPGYDSSRECYTQKANRCFDVHLLLLIELVYWVAAKQ